MHKTWECALLAVIKGKNISSAKLVDKVKAVVHNEYPNVKLGHGGTLDETATGVLVIGVGLGCKLLPKFLHGNKVYTVEATLGSETETYNECGRIVDKKPFSHVTSSLIFENLRKFQGSILQTPPKYSALKLQGRRASDWMRSGVDVELIPRQVTCHSIKLLKFDGCTMRLSVECGGGFYVRSLVHDLGKALGTYAHVTQLHRNRHGFLAEHDALPDTCWSYADLLENARRISQMKQFTKMAKGHRKPRKTDEIWIDPT